MPVPVLRRHHLPRVSHAIGALAGAALVGCSLLTGASDLTTAPSSVGGDAGSNADGAPDDDGGGRSEAGGADGGGSDAAIDAPLNTSIRAITFESRMLVGMDGADSVVGMPTLDSMAPLRGSTSMEVDMASTYAVATFASHNDLYFTFLFQIGSLGEVVGPATAPIFRLDSDKDATPIEVQVDGTANLLLKLAGSSVSLGTVRVGTVYRVGAHVGAGLPTRLVVDAQAVEGPTTPFDGKFAHLAVFGTSGYNRVSFGALSTVIVPGRFDHVLLDATAMPLP